MTTAEQKIASLAELIADATDALTAPVIQAHPLWAARIKDGLAEAKRQIAELERADYSRPRNTSTT